MALSAKTNQLTGAGSTGNQATTDPGFQPKGLIIWNGLQTATGASADAQFSLGVASSTTTETEAGYNSDDNIATSDAVRQFSTTRLIVNSTSGTTTANIVADLTSFDATGFTLNWATLTTTSPLFNYLALGGADITNVKSGNFAAATSGATQAVTGIGFQPDIVFLFGNLNASATTANNNNQYSMGVMTPTAQWAVGQRTQSGAATMNTTRNFATDRAFQLVASAANTEFDGRSFASMDSDGFTLNIDVQGGSAVLIGYLAIKGGRWKVGTETQKTSTGTKATTGVGFTPSGAIFAGNGDTAAGISDHARFFFGATTGASNNVAHWTGDRDNVPDAIANSITSATKSIVMATEATSASPTTNAEAALSSFDSDGFTLNWTTADATARLFGYVAFGDNASSGTTVTPSTASLAITPYAPTVVLPKLVTAGLLTMSLASFTPQVNLQVTPPTTNLSVTTFAPLISTTANVVVTPSTTALVTTAYAPVVVLPQTVTPGVASLITTGFAPQINLGIITQTTPLSITTFAPAVTSGTSTTVTPGVVNLIIAGFAPQVNLAVIPPTVSLALTSFTPTVSTPRLVVPSTTGLIISSYAPSVIATNNQVVTAGIGTLVITSYAPKLDLTVTPATKALVLSELAPGVSATANVLVVPSTSTLQVATYQPSVNITVGPTAYITISAEFSSPTVAAVFAMPIVASFMALPVVPAEYTRPQLTAEFTLPTIPAEYSNPSIEAKVL